jgi:hypothetical protein
VSVLPIIAGREGVQPLQVENLHAVGHGGVHGVDRLETVFTVVNVTVPKLFFRIFSCERRKDYMIHCVIQLREKILPFWTIFIPTSAELLCLLCCCFAQF